VTGNVECRHAEHFDQPTPTFSVTLDVTD